MSEIRERLAVVLEEEMDRKRFLQYSLAVFLAAFGVSGFISAILNNKASKSTQSGPSRGYGSSRFGKS
ncbi:MAG: hypothetical protein JWN28_164 [Candidatus Saccharibacteria bacterium]|nr:hypothetical protein [Candidatus Saccharibacteria bacterium]